MQARQTTWNASTWHTDYFAVIWRGKGSDSKTMQTRSSAFTVVNALS
jgi:hypothetical protein